MSDYFPIEAGMFWTYEADSSRGRRIVRVEGVVEFPLPPVVGASWTAGGDSLRIASDRATVSTPAGRFTDCLKVEVLLAGGDAGSAERFYAPGLGLVRESISEEGEPSDKRLLSYGRSSL